METKKRYPSRLQIRFLWLLVTLFATTFVYAQNSNDSIIVDTLASGEPVYNCMKVDQKPEFPGGEEALLTDYLCAYYYDPRVYICEQGLKRNRVIISLVIDKEGNVKKPKIIRDLDPWFDLTALNLVNSLPTWKPGLLNGKAIATKYVVLVRFREIYPKANDIASVMECLLDLCNTPSWDNVWIDIEGKKSDSHFLKTIDPNNLEYFLVLKNTASVTHFTSDPKYKAVLLITLKKSK